MNHRWKTIPKRTLITLAVIAFWLLVTAASCGTETTTGSTSQDPVIPHIVQRDHGWVDPTNTVDQKTMSALRSASDRFQNEGFQLAGMFFSNIASESSQFCSDAGNQNGIGSGSKDNGLLIIVLLDKKGDDGNKPYIFVCQGRGLEALLNDAKITEFRAAYFNPARKDGNWQQGLITLTNKFADYLATPDAKEFSDESLTQIASTANPSLTDEFAKLPALAQLLLCLVGLIIGGFLFYCFILYIRDGGGSGGSGGSYGGSSGGGSYGGGGSFGGGGSGG